MAAVNEGTCKIFGRKGSKIFIKVGYENDFCFGARGGVSVAAGGAASEILLNLPQHSRPRLVLGGQDLNQLGKCSGASHVV